MHRACGISLGYSLGARTTDSKFPLWEPSQNGFLFDRPHRHNEKVCFVVNVLPSVSTKSTSPVILNEPLSFTLIVTFDTVTNTSLRV